MPTKLDDFHDAIKKSLQKQYPDMKDDELEQKAWAMAQKAFKDWKANQSTQPSVEKFTEDGKRIISEHILKENVRINIDSPIEEDK